MNEARFARRRGEVKGLAEVTVLNVGARLRSSVSATEVVVVRGPSEEIELSCGGAAMVPSASAGAGSGGAVEPVGSTLLGKRYVDGASGLEVLCIKPGAGQLAASGRPLAIKAPTALPASD
jgi:hypothetical protein